MMNNAGRNRNIAPFYVMEILEKAREMESRGEHIIHMEIGEPDFMTPEVVKEAAIRAIRENRTFYTQSLGMPALRERIARFYFEKDGIEVSPERVIVTNGTSGAFMLLCAVLTDKKNPLAVSDPGYPCYRNFGALFDAPVLPLPVSEETRFEVTRDHLAAADKRPRLLIIASPSNPTGTIYRQDTLRALHAQLSGEGGRLVVDEIYNGLVYGKPEKSALAVSGGIIVVNGFSKTYAMTGWRLGWMVVPEELVRPVQIVAQNVFISPSTISQHAAMKVFDAGKEIEEMRRTYQERRDFLLPRLKHIGFKIPADPAGAFYIYADIGKWGIDSREFAQRALEEAKVAITHGYDFGSYRAAGHVRFSYANSLEMLTLGCDRLEKWVKTLL